MGGYANERQPTRIDRPGCATEWIRRFGGEQPQLLTLIEATSYQSGQGVQGRLGVRTVGLQLERGAALGGECGQVEISVTRALWSIGLRKW